MADWFLRDVKPEPGDDARTVLFKVFKEIIDGEWGPYPDDNYWKLADGTLAMMGQQLLPGDRNGWLTLHVGYDGLYDYRYSQGKDDAWVVRLLRHIAEQVECGAHIQDLDSPKK
jgi:hypothetical protein